MRFLIFKENYHINYIKILRNEMIIAISASFAITLTYNYCKKLIYNIPSNKDDFLFILFISFYSIITYQNINVYNNINDNDTHYYLN